LEHVDNDVLQTQIDVWLGGLEQDETELFQRLESDRIDIEDLAEFSQIVTKNMKTTSCENPYFSIQRHLSLLSTSSFERLKYLTVIDKLIQQLVLQKNGENFDPLVAVSNLDTTHFGGEINASSNEYEQKYQKQLEKTKWLQKELDQINGGKKTSIPGASTSQDNTAEPVVLRGPPPPPMNPVTGLAGPRILLLIQHHHLRRQ
jgi:dishevelled associated activator of morphogenesis